MFDLILRGGHLVDPSQGIDAKRDVAFSDGKVVAIRERIDEAARDTRDVGGLFVAPGLIDLSYPRLLGRHFDRRRCCRRRPTRRHDHPGRCRKRRSRQLSRISPPCHRAVGRPHPGLSEYLVPRHLCLQQAGDGRGVRGYQAARSGRVRARHQRAPRFDRGRQSARRQGGQRSERRRTARYGGRGRRGNWPSGHGASRSPAAHAQGGAVAPAAG